MALPGCYVSGYCGGRRLRPGEPQPAGQVAVTLCHSELSAMARSKAGRSSSGMASGQYRPF